MFIAWPLASLSTYGGLPAKTLVCDTGIESVLGDRGCDGPEDQAYDDDGHKAHMSVPLTPYAQAGAHASKPRHFGGVSLVKLPDSSMGA
jgi:hypothetical protein